VNSQLHGTNDNFKKILFSIFISNYNKIQLLSNKPREKNSLMNFKLNIQTMLTHQNYFNSEDFSILLQLYTKQSNIIYEINQNDLSSLITRLKEIYGKIKID